MNCIEDEKDGDEDLIDVILPKEVEKIYVICKHGKNVKGK